MSSTPVAVAVAGAPISAELEAKLASYVATAINDKRRGIASSYNQLLGFLRASGEQQRQWYTGLAKCVSLIKPDLEALQDLVLTGFVWSTASPALISVYLRFLVNLVVANGQYLMPVLKILVKTVTGPIARPKPASASTDSAAAAAAATAPCPPSTALSSLLQAFKEILRLVPTAAQCLHPILTDNFPHKSASIESQRHYVHVMLKFCVEAPILMDRLLTCVMERLIQLDVSIKVEADEDERDEELIFAMNSKRAKSHKSAAADSNSTAIDGTSLAAASIEMANKLDELMVEVFDTLKAVYVRGGSSSRGSGGAGAGAAGGGGIDPENRADAMFVVLIQNFERSILKTHKSRVTQFVLFFVCSIKHGYAEAFVKMLAAVCIYRHLPHPHPHPHTSRSAFNSRAFLSYRKQWIERRCRSNVKVQPRI